MLFVDFLLSSSSCLWIWLLQLFTFHLFLKTSQLKIIFYKIANNEVEILERLWAIILIWLCLIFVNCAMNCFVVYLTPKIVFSQILHVLFEVSKFLKIKLQQNMFRNFRKFQKINLQPTYSPLILTSMSATAPSVLGFFVCRN